MSSKRWVRIFGDAPMRPVEVFCLRGVWVEASDFVPMGEPEIRVEHGDSDLTLSLLIPRPFGQDSDAMLEVHATEVPDDPGGVITLAITGAVVRDLRPGMDMDLLSGPRRYVDMDHWREGDGG